MAGWHISIRGVHDDEEHVRGVLSALVEHIVELLRGHGLTEATVSTGADPVTNVVIQPDEPAEAEPAPPAPSEPEPEEPAPAEPEAAPEEPVNPTPVGPPTA